VHVREGVYVYVLGGDEARVGEGRGEQRQVAQHAQERGARLVRQRVEDRALTRVLVSYQQVG
jgi:hypothetical protein